MKHQPLMNRITATGRVPRCACGWQGIESSPLYHRGRSTIRRQVFAVLAGHLHSPKAA